MWSSDFSLESWRGCDFFLFWEAGGVNRVEWFRIFRNLFRVASSVEKLDLCRGKDLGNLGWNGS